MSLLLTSKGPFTKARISVLPYEYLTDPSKFLSTSILIAFTTLLELNLSELVGSSATDSCFFGNQVAFKTLDLSSSLPLLFQSIKVIERRENIHLQPIRSNGNNGPLIPWIFCFRLLFLPHATRHWERSARWLLLFISFLNHILT